MKTRQYEIDGTAVRKRATRVSAPRREEEWQEEKPKKQQQPLRQKNQRQKELHEKRLAPKSAAPAIDFGTLMLLLVALIVTFYTCYSYLEKQSDIFSIEKEISRLRKETEELVAKNDNTELEITKSIDLEQIQKTAMEELGMVYPYNNQMIRYESEENGYVRQYGELLGNEQESMMKMLLKMLLSSGQKTDIPAQDEQEEQDGEEN